MRLLDGGSKLNRFERFRARTQWVACVCVALGTIAGVVVSLRKHDGQAWKYVVVGAVFIGISVWRHPKQD
jgi:hypothetical protein